MNITGFEAVAYSGSRKTGGVTYEVFKLYASSGECWRFDECVTTVAPSLASLEAARVALTVLHEYGYLSVEHHVNSQATFDSLSGSPQLTDPGFATIRSYQHMRAQFMNFQLVLTPAAQLQHRLAAAHSAASDTVEDLD